MADIGASKEDYETIMSGSKDPSGSFEDLKSSSHRLNWLMHDLSSPQSKRGLEIGALDNPTPMPNGVVIEYVDYAATEHLQNHPHEDTVKKQSIVNVDHIWPGSGSLKDICGRNDYDFVIASHVIEHVPNVLGWLNGIYEVLRPGGIFNLAIPDKRFTFDVGRRVSTLGEMVEAYLGSYKIPSVRQVFDHTFGALAVAPGEPWNAGFNRDSIPKYSGDVALHLAFDQSKFVKQNGNYYDSHCWVFTPSSFLDAIENAIKLDLFPFIMSDIQVTQPGSFEFFLSLRKENCENEDLFRSWQISTVRYLRDHRL